MTSDNKFLGMAFYVQAKFISMSFTHLSHLSSRFEILHKAHIFGPQRAKTLLGTLQRTEVTQVPHVL